MADVSHVTAGSFELVALQWDEPTSKPGDPFTYKRHRQGDVVTLDEATAKRLVAAGAVVEPGAREKAQAAALRAQLDAVLARLPEDQRKALQADAAPAATGDASGEPERPARAANKDVWVDYVVAKGTPREDANKMTVEQLQSLYAEH